MSNMNDMTNQEIPDEIIEALVEILPEIIKAYEAYVASIAEVIKWAVENIPKICDDLLDVVVRAFVPPKWWHIYTHTKKARIRKKYRDRIMRAVLEALAADGGDET